ncbi:MAG: hypothetical protein K9G64_01790 [Bacteroidia bacterium]|nr:hypothetical protein [Bacteroidia bacterium]
MNIAIITTIFSVIMLLIFTGLSLIKTQNITLQLVSVVVTSFCIGIITCIILVNYDNKSALIWPGLFVIMIINKVIEINKNLR